MTEYEMRVRALQRYGLPTELPGWLDAGWLTNRIDEGIRTIAEEAECLNGSCRMGTSLAVRTITPTTNFVRIGKVVWLRGGETKELERVNQTYVAALEGDDWQNATGQPTRWMNEAGNQITLSPIPTGGGTVIAHGPRYPGDLGGFYSADSTSGLQVPTALHDALALYLCREIASVDSSASAEAKQQRFGAGYQAAIAKYKHVRPSPPLT